MMRGPRPTTGRIMHLFPIGGRVHRHHQNAWSTFGDNGEAGQTEEIVTASGPGPDVVTPSCRGAWVPALDEPLDGGCHAETVCVFLSVSLDDRKRMDLRCLEAGGSRQLREARGQLGMHEVFLPQREDGVGAFTVVSRPDAGPPVGVDEHHSAPDRDDAVQLCESPDDIGNILKDLDGNCLIARAVGDRKRGGVGKDKAAVPGHPGMTRIDTSRGQHAGLSVQSQDPAVRPHVRCDLSREVARSTTEVEHAVLALRVQELPSPTPLEPHRRSPVDAVKVMCRESLRP